jgi:hypothetical protein
VRNVNTDGSLNNNNANNANGLVADCIRDGPLKVVLQPEATKSALLTQGVFDPLPLFERWEE